MKLKSKKSLHFILLLISFFVFTASISMGYAQNVQRTVSGIVTNKLGEALVGVNVSVKEDKTKGTITDVDGKYTLSDLSANATLIFSYIGMTASEVRVAGKEKIDVVMSENATGLDQVVVTAFATQKKVNITGAISTVSGSDIVSIPVSNISNALIGNAPGVSGLQTSGEAGHNAANIRIRGIATYGGGNANQPLIVIDGVEQAAEQAFSELNSIDPNEILGISVLKDASSTAVYGIRAANGVIIITTKRGLSGKPVISFSSNYGVTRAASLQHNVSSYNYGIMRNESLTNEMNSFATAAGYGVYLFSDDDLWKFKNNRDFTPAEVAAMTNLTPEQRTSLLNSPAIYYGSHDLYAELFSRTGPQSQFNVNIAGGTDKVKYFASIGYFSQGGINLTEKYYDINTQSAYNRYNFRSNFDINPFHNLKISINLAGQMGSSRSVYVWGDPYDTTGRYAGILLQCYASNPMTNMGIMDGHLVRQWAGVPGSIQNPLAIKLGIAEDYVRGPSYDLLSNGSSMLDNTLLDTSIKLEHELDYLLKNLKIRGTVSYQDNYSRETRIWPSVPWYTVQRNLENPNIIEYFGGQYGNTGFDQWGRDNWNKLYFDAGLEWAGNFNRHSISALLLGKASQYYMPGDGSNVPSGVMGLVGRATYNFDERYLFEVNIGYNGTEQFAKGRRFGFFPAFSAGWVLTNEKFFPTNQYVTFVKIRGSFGEVGNDLLGSSGRRFLYLPNTYNLNQGGYWWGNTGTQPSNYFSGTTEGSLGNPLVTWERAKKYDGGVELKFFTNRLSLTYDYFRENRYDILTTLGIIPANYGVYTWQVPPANVGQTRNQGYELVLGWSDKINRVGYSIEGNVNYAKNKILYMAEAPNPYYWMNQTGFSIGQRFGLKSDGLYNTPEELQNRPFNTFTGNKATLGDVRYLDLNGDGVIDNKDLAPIGYPNFPEYGYGIKVGLNYRGFDLNALFSGTMHGSFYINSSLATEFNKYAGNAWQWQFDGRWTPEKYAAGDPITYPRATFSPNVSDNNFLQSDYWIFSNDYLKLRNMEIGYTVPTKVKFMQSAHISSLRVYMNGNNLITFQNAMRKIGIDPETQDQNTQYIYPLTRVFNMGFQIKF